MKKVRYDFILVTALLAAVTAMNGCGKTETDSPEGSEFVIEETTENQETTRDVTATTEESGTTANPQKPLYEGTPYTWNEITVMIPNEWKDKYEVKESESGFFFLQKASNEKEEGMGLLCGIACSDGPVYELAGERLLAYTDSQMYYMTVPTDVAFYYEDEDISEEYGIMSQYVVAMGESIQIEKEGVHYNPREYILPMSDVSPMDADVMTYFNDNELWIARNEMFARHGLKFENAYLQWHFDTCSWYEGTLEPGTFDEGVFSDVEKENLRLMVEAEAEYRKQNKYPRAEQIDTDVICDLDEDGTAETLRYLVMEVEKDGYAEYEASITVDDMMFNLEEYEVFMVNPETATFYLTDISPYFEGLEIAVMDYGPSDDSVTHFFTFDGSLHLLGTVSGFPFKEMGDLNGFADFGTVKGWIRTDIINSCYGYANWWYDYDNKKLVLQETGYYQMAPGGAHELYEELPVYHDMNTKALQTTIPPQKEVYFTLTDGEEWIQVKGKDGSQGFVHILDGTIEGLDKNAREVFSDLEFFD